jgi:membrane-bound ClpP family serine protease
MEPYLWPTMLLLAGIAIICVELFVPSGGVLAVLAGLCFLGSIGLAFTRSVQSGLIMLTVTAIVVPALLAAGVHVWPNTPIGRRILGKRPDHPDEVLPDSEAYRGLKDLIGRRGTAGCKMLPGGTVVVDRRSYEAISLGMAIDERAPIEVVDVRMGRLVVRPCDMTESRHESVSPEATGPKSDDVLSRPIDSLGIDDPLA